MSVVLGKLVTMTVTPAPPAPAATPERPDAAEPSSAPAAWTLVDSGLWVAARDGAHLGRVDIATGSRFHAFSAVGRSLGRHTSLASAQAAVEARGADPRLGLGQMPLAVVATVSGVAAVIMATVAVWMLPVGG